MYIPNWQQPNYKMFFQTDQRLRISDSFVPNTANYGHPHNGNVGFEEAILNVTDHHPRESVHSVA
jgi:hypothetical protein